VIYIDSDTIWLEDPYVLWSRFWAMPPEACIGIAAENIDPGGFLNGTDGQAPSHLHRTFKHRCLPLTCHCACSRRHHMRLVSEVVCRCALHRQGRLRLPAVPFTYALH
jgi:hypothetical protein